MKIIERIRKYMEEKDADMKCNNFTHTVEVSHQDGSHFLFQNAIMDYKTFGEMKMLLVWTEHCGYHFFFIDDLTHWRKYSIVNG